jgi:hypothetical protein
VLVHQVRKLANLGPVGPSQPAWATLWSVPDFIDNGLGCQVGEFPES